MIRKSLLSVLTAELRLLSLILFVVTLQQISLKAESDSCWTILLKEKKYYPLIENDTMNVYSHNGFYLLKNCYYSYNLTNGKHYYGKIIDINKDSLFITTAFSKNCDMNNIRNKYDTLKLKVSDIKRIRLTSQYLATEKTYNYFDLSDFDIIIKKQRNYCGYSSKQAKVYTNIDSLYEIYPYLTTFGIAWIYEDEEDVKIFEPKNSKWQKKIDTNYLWLPVCLIPPADIPVDQINGIAAGLLSGPSNRKEVLTINGLSIDINPLGLVSTIFFVYAFPDSSYFTRKYHFTNVIVNGVCLSPGSYLLYPAYSGIKIKGFFLGGSFTDINEINGFSISGVSTVVREFSGVCISGLRNLALYGSGLQIGLYNSCWNFRGIQIGLWNHNNGSSLPFINWNFD